MEQVNHPRHYKIASPLGWGILAVLGIPENLLEGGFIAAIEHLESSADSRREYRFVFYNAVKYLWRAGEKEGGAVIDLENARWYLRRWQGDDYNNLNKYNNALCEAAIVMIDRYLAQFEQFRQTQSLPID